VALGYLRAAVTPRVVLEHAPDRATLIFAIAAGPRTRIGTIEFGASSEARERALLDRFGLSPGAPYEPDVLNERLAE
jgi:outer membrane translocation and assembly module TamA